MFVEKIRVQVGAFSQSVTDAIRLVSRTCTCGSPHKVASELVAMSKDAKGHLANDRRRLADLFLMASEGSLASHNHSTTRETTDSTDIFSQLLATKKVLDDGNKVGGVIAEHVDAAAREFFQVPVGPQICPWTKKIQFDRDGLKISAMCVGSLVCHIDGVKYDFGFVHNTASRNADDNRLWRDAKGKILVRSLDHTDGSTRWLRCIKTQDGDVFRFWVRGENSLRNDVVRFYKVVDGDLTPVGKQVYEAILSMLKGH